ncbi:MAG: winged helix-turn-helix transcriptional regulator [Mycoplasma sp.]|nr:winged helix-turn-helix transcriptional regulator [Mycoplasma sp.]
MNIHEFLKILACETKLKLLTYIYSCNCKYCVNDLVKKIGTSQANISKHLIQMEKEGVLKKEIIQKTSYYKVNDNFIKKWKNILEPIFKKNILKNVLCNCVKNKI